MSAEASRPDFENSPSFLNGRVRVVTGDLTCEQVDVIVNAANSTLLGGGGVDGAIHARGGPEILAACRELRRTLVPDGLPAGEAVLTTAGRLPARHVIHTVGPVYGLHNGQEAILLANCYRNSLSLAAEHAMARIAFPAISTGAYGYPRHEAAAVASRAIGEFLASDDFIREVRLVFFNSGDAAAFLKHQKFDEFDLSGHE